MCRGLYAGAASPYNFTYQPVVDKECMHVSTFWISHPNNTYINNSAAGSQEVGYFIAFYREPTGPSAGTLPPFHGERTALQLFERNRAHSNPLAGFLIDSGIKTTYPSTSDLRDFLALIDLERYAPHVDRNLSLPRVPANVTNFTGYKNTLGLFVRGGDVWISNAKLSDNDVAVIMASSSSLPYDAGSHQQIVDSMIVGRSFNDSSWVNRSRPCVGVEIRDGPILVNNNDFRKFVPAETRAAYAVGFYPNNAGQNSPQNTVGSNRFEGNISQKLFLGQVSGYYGSYNKDGDLTQILFDRAGNLTGQPSSYVVRVDNGLLATGCQALTGIDYAVYCNGSDYGQLFINVTSKNASLVILDVGSNASLTLTGFNAVDFTNFPTTTQYQPVLIANHTYKLSWQPGTTQPSNIDLSMYNFDQYSSVMLQLSYMGGRFNITSRKWIQSGDQTVGLSILVSATSYTDFVNKQETTYFYDTTASLLHVKLFNSSPANTNDPFNYCPVDGCSFVNIMSK
jgi:cell migration-inducing and hyaluronan-binding protein